MKEYMSLNLCLFIAKLADKISIVDYRIEDDGKDPLSYP